MEAAPQAAESKLIIGDDIARIIVLNLLSEPHQDEPSSEQLEAIEPYLLEGSYYLTVQKAFERHIDLLLKSDFNPNEIERTKRRMKAVLSHLHVHNRVNHAEYRNWNVHQLRMNVGRLVSLAYKPANSNGMAELLCGQVIGGQQPGVIQESRKIGWESQRRFHEGRGINKYPVRVLD